MSKKRCIESYETQVRPLKRVLFGVFALAMSAIVLVGWDETVYQNPNRATYEFRDARDDSMSLSDRMQASYSEGAKERYVRRAAIGVFYGTGSWASTCLFRQSAFELDIREQAMLSGINLQWDSINGFEVNQEDLAAFNAIVEQVTQEHLAQDHAQYQEAIKGAEQRWDDRFSRR